MYLQKRRKKIRKKEGSVALVFSALFLMLGMLLVFWSKSLGNGFMLNRLLQACRMYTETSHVSAFLFLSLPGLCMWLFGFSSMGLPFIYACLLWVGINWGYDLSQQISDSLSVSIKQLGAVWLLPAVIQLPLWCQLSSRAQMMSLEPFRVRRGRMALKRETDRCISEYFMIFLVFLILFFVSFETTSKFK